MTSTNPRFDQTSIFLALLLSSYTLSLSAETRYVTDELQLSMYEEINSQGKMIKRLNSGTELELLETQGLYAKVRTQEGLEGWTKAGFLISEKPARAQLIDANQRVEALEKQLKQSHKALETVKTDLENSQSGPSNSDRNDELKERLANAEKIAASVDQLKQENQSLRQQLDKQVVENEIVYAEGIPLKWGLIGSAVTLLLGILGGMALFDYRSRRRHGGYRIY
jgi:SH3 domain protein